MANPNQIIILDDIMTSCEQVQSLVDKMRTDGLRPEVERLNSLALQEILAARELVCSDWGVSTYADLAIRLGQSALFDEVGARRTAKDSVRRAFRCECGINLDEVAYAVATSASADSPVSKEVWSLMNDLEELNLADCMYVRREKGNFELVEVAIGS